MLRFSANVLNRLRNEVPVRFIIDSLLQFPTKEVEGVYRFLCPLCGEFETKLNLPSNLGRCFRCRRNFNPIELIMAGKGLNFVESVTLLRQSEPLLNAEPERRQAELKEAVAKLVERLCQNFSLPNTACAGD